jgi:hypothetical protein
MAIEVEVRSRHASLRLPHRDSNSELYMDTSRPRRALNHDVLSALCYVLTNCSKHDLYRTLSLSKQWQVCRRVPLPGQSFVNLSPIKV